MLIFSIRAGNRVVIYQGTTISENNELSRIKRNLGGGWINDAIMKVRISAILLETSVSSTSNSDKRMEESYFYSKYKDLLTEFGLVNSKDPIKLQHIGKSRMKKFDSLKVNGLNQWFFPINVNNTHWVVAVVNVEECICDVYDSGPQFGSNVDMQVQYAIQYTYSMRYYFENNQDKKSNYFNIISNLQTMVAIRHPLKDCKTLHQKNGYDCGMFVLCYIENLYKKKNILEICQTKVSQYRKQMVGYFDNLLNNAMEIDK